MDIVKKILQLIPDNWSDVLAQSDEFEAYLATAETFVLDNKPTVKNFIVFLLQKITIDWDTVNEFITSTLFYQQLDKIKLDIPAWLAIPDDFDWDDQTQRETFIQQKIQLLDDALVDIEISQFPLVEVLAQIEELILTIANTPMDIDFEDLDAVNELKNALMDSLKPKVFKLIETIFNIDLSQSIANTGLDKIQSLTDQLTNTSNKESSPSDTDTDTVNDTNTINNSDNTNPANTSDIPLPDELEQAMAMLGKLKSVLPQIRQALADVNLEGVNIDELIDSIETFITFLEKELPDLFEASLALFSDMDWEDLEVNALIYTIKQFFTLLKEFIQSSPFADWLPLINLPNSPIQLVGFDEGMTTEQKLAAFLEKAQALIDIPDDIESKTPTEIIAWLKEKLEGLMALLQHIELFGYSLKDFLDACQEPIDALFSVPDDARFDSLSGIMEFVLGKLVLIVQLFQGNNNDSNDNTDSSSTTPSTPGNPDQGDNQPSSQTSPQPTPQSTTNNSSPFATVLQFILETAQKIQLIWQFIRDNNIGLTLKDQAPEDQFPEWKAPPSTDPPANNSPTNNQPTDNQPQSNNGKGGTSSPNTQTQPQTNTGDTQPPTDTSSGTDNPSTQEPPTVDNSDLLRVLLGNRETGLISLLEKQYQDIILGMLEGTWQQAVENQLVAYFEQSGLKTEFETQYQRLLDLLNLPIESTTNNANTEPPTVGKVLVQLLSAIQLLYQAGLVLLQQAINYLIDLLFEVISMIFTLLQSIKIPEKIKKGIPDLIIKPFLQGKDPNLLCLVLAMPTMALKKLLVLPVEELVEWVGHVV